jgi:hypothetical protein
LVLLVLGSGGAAWAGNTYRRLNQIEPARLAERILKLARTQRKSETTAAEVTAALGAPAENVDAALEVLKGRGEAQMERREDRWVYVFPGLKTSLVERRCPYCGVEFPVKQAITQCPNCGGKIELQKT